MSSICAFSVFSVKFFRLPSYCVGAIISEYVTFVQQYTHRVLVGVRHRVLDYVSTKLSGKVVTVIKKKLLLTIYISTIHFNIYRISAAYDNTMIASSRAFNY